MQYSLVLRRLGQLLRQVGENPSQEEVVIYDFVSFSILFLSFCLESMIRHIFPMRIITVSHFYTSWNTMRESWQFILIFLAQVQALANQADKEGTGNLKWELCLSNKSIFGKKWPLVKIGYLSFLHDCYYFWRSWKVMFMLQTFGIEFDQFLDSIKLKFHFQQNILQYIFFCPKVSCFPGSNGK